MEYDILVIGATGYTGRVLVDYIGIHKVAPTLRIALGGRTLSKVQELARLSDKLHAVQVDVSNPASVDAAVSKTRVVINLAGPYWTHGSTVVRFCAIHGTHYVDLTGEPYWIAKIIEDYDYLAHKNGACIIPGSGFDSIPSDLTAYLSTRTLEQKLGTESLDIRSVASHTMKGFGPSGGTVATMFNEIEQVPASARKKGTGWRLSPVSGRPTGRDSRPKILYSLPYIRPTIYGGFFPMAPVNEPLVRRSWGLRHVSSTQSASFSYHEFAGTSSALRGIALSLAWVAFGLSMALLPPFRWLMKRVLPASGGGPPRDQLEKGWFEVVNVSEAKGIVAKSVIKGNGEPGYYLTPWMIFESALLLLDPSNLTPMGRAGGILTPSTAFGDKLAPALEATGKFDISTEILHGQDSKKSR